MSGICIRQFGLLIAVVAAFPSLCCGQLVFADDETPAKVTCCHSEPTSPAGPALPTEPVNDCCCQQSTIPTSSVEVRHSELESSLPFVVLAEPKATLTTSSRRTHHFAVTGPPLHLLQCVWLI